MEPNKDIASYLVTKHSWKGKYKRIFSVGTACLKTYNPQTLEVTNQWPYKDVHFIKPVTRSGSVPGEFCLQVKTRGKVDTLKFSSDYTTNIVTDTLAYGHLFSTAPSIQKDFKASKKTWRGTFIDVKLRLSDKSLLIVNYETCLAISEYQFKDIVEIIKVANDPKSIALVLGSNRRLHVFSCDHADQIIALICETSIENIGASIHVKIDPFYDLNWCLENRFGRLSSELHITSLVEFTVYKKARKSEDVTRRILGITEKCLIERDLLSYRIISLRPLDSIHCLVISCDNEQDFMIQFVCDVTCKYSSTERDNVLTSLLDSVRASGNANAYVKSTLCDRGLRWLPYNTDLDDDAESIVVRLVSAQQNGSIIPALERFNANIPYSGLMYSVTQEGFFTENKEKLIISCLTTIVDTDTQKFNPCSWETFFQALRRLFASKAGFHAFTTVPKLREKLGTKVLQAIKLESVAVTYAALDCLCCLMQPMHSNYELRQEQLNKSSLLSSAKFLGFLLEAFCNHVVHNTGALLIMSMLDFLTYSLCDPYSETTVGEQFDQLLEMVVQQAQTFYHLFQHPASAIVKGSGLIMKALIEESTEDISQKLQEYSLTEGALLRHLHSALFTTSKDLKFLANRQLSRKLVALWVANNEDAEKLLQQILPKGMVNLLKSNEQAPSNEEEFLFTRNNLDIATNQTNSGQNTVMDQVSKIHTVLETQVDLFLQHWRIRQDLNFIRQKDKTQKPITLRRRRKRVLTANYNWKLFYYTFSRDCNRSDLIWNHKTRDELKEALENEIRALDADKEIAGTIATSWNFQEYEVTYPSLSNEIKIGDYYLRVLLEEDKAKSYSVNFIDSQKFFMDVYHRLLLTTKVEMKCLCLKALTITYQRCGYEIGVFHDTKFFLAMLEQSTDLGERDNLVMFLESLCKNKENVIEMVKCSNLKYLVDLACLIHISPTSNRVHVPTQTNVIEDSPDSHRDSAQEWYLTNQDKERSGPYSFNELKEMHKNGKLSEKTKCWAQGMDQWKSMLAVPQFRWSFFSTGHAQISSSNLTILILNMLIKICQFYPSRSSDNRIICPIPRIKMLLADPAVLPHIVQLFLSFDPIIVEKTATLLFLIIQDNITASRIYLTGAFYFCLMYTGSNVLPIARFLYAAHDKQAYRSIRIMKHGCISFLHEILPEATIYYLTNHGAEKYAQVFLGNFENPEVIWNAEMRRFMIEKLAAHVADISRVLPSNIKSTYQYCPIAPVHYDLLENEQFCHMYYLRHLCDVTRFPDWPIKEPVEFLKCCLETWMLEIEQHEELLTVAEACNILSLETSDLNKGDGLLRKAYFKMAHKYHPDKNPEGRAQFEKINEAYEYLLAKINKSSKGTKDERILICIRAQSIVFIRYREELAPYKYAGYYQLIETIKTETEKEELFSRPVSMLEACTELCFRTIQCSSLNAEQLGRENGLQTLKHCFDRCITVIGHSSPDSDLTVQVCVNILFTIEASCTFELCLEKFEQLDRSFFDQLVKLLKFKHLIKLATSVCAVMSVMSRKSSIQLYILESGALWYLLPYVFRYDFTLDEGGVEKSVEKNEQQAHNILARASFDACCCLSGIRNPCPKNGPAQGVLKRILSQHVCKMAQNPDLDNEVLKILNTNSESPNLVWNNVTRAELKNYLELRQKRISAETLPFDEISDFDYSIYAKHVIVGNMFVDVYNKQPEFVIEEPERFCQDLLRFLNDQMKSLSDESDEKKMVDSILTVLVALKHLLTSDSALRIKCVGHFGLLFSLLALTNRPEVQEACLKVIGQSVSDERCSQAIAGCKGLTVHLLLLMATNATLAEEALKVLATLAAQVAIGAEMLENGACVYLLFSFCNDERFEVRLAAAETLSKLSMDKLNGPRWTRLLSKFLPQAFLELIRDQPSACLQLFDSDTENPELSWKEETRHKVQNYLRVIKDEICDAQLRDSTFKWNVPDDFPSVFDSSTDTSTVCGVNLRLFGQNPSWVVRNPKKFASELLERIVHCLKCLEKIDNNPENQKNGHNQENNEMLDLLTKALTGLFDHQQHLIELVASQGYVGGFIDLLKTRNSDGVTSLLHILQRVFKSEFCVKSFTKSTHFLANMEKFIESSSANEEQRSLASFTLRILFETGSKIDELVKQTVQTEFLNFMLKMLQENTQKNPVNFTQNRAITANYVTALKALSENPNFSDQVSEVLNNAEVYKEFKSQKHDLFLARNSNTSSLTAPGVAGYLTQGLSTNNRAFKLPP